jgi:hypothetical protein
MLYPYHDFEAAIRIYPPEEGGRREAAFNGIRWDFEYVDSLPDDPLFIIWPDFCDSQGNSLSSDQPLPVGVEMPARMLILNDELRINVHRSRIVPGAHFYCREGPYRVAEGVITRITGLFEPRDAEK